VAGPPLEYTQQALEREVEGTMLVECVVSVDGVVHDCRVLKGLPFMDRAVVSNLEHRRYKPATMGGKALDVQYVFTIRLKLPQ
jgi:protein TonB